MPACLLALDSATEHLALGLQAANGRQWRLNTAGGAQASARLLPAVHGLLAQAGLRMADLQAVGFGQGPGAFTGLRTACAVAQGLAFGIGCPVLALDSLLLLAEDARGQLDPADAKHSAPWWVAMDARMDEVYAAQYQAFAPSDSQGAPGAGGWQVLTPPALYTLPALTALWQAAPPRRLAGNAATAFADRLPLAGVRTWPHSADRAAALLRLAQQAWDAGLQLDPDQALPLYVRDKVAQTTAERAALSAVAASASASAAPG